MSTSGGESSSDQESGLELHWSFGFSWWIPRAVHDLYLARPNCLAMAAGINAIIYNYVSGKQQLLIGHSTAIGSLTVTQDCAMIITSEAEPHPDSLVIIWESRTANPIATLSETRGVRSSSASPDGKTVALLTTTNVVRMWNWAQNTSLEVELENEFTEIRFNPQDPSEIVATNAKCIAFMALTASGLSVEMSELPSVGGSRPTGTLTHSVYSTNKREIFSGTSLGCVVIWGVHFGETRRGFIKSVPLESASAITAIDVVKNLIAVCSEDNALRFLDFKFRIVFWFEDFNYGPIQSVSFSPVGSDSNARDGPTLIDLTPISNKVDIPEFIIATSGANIVKLTLESIAASPKRGSPRGFLLVKGFESPPVSIASHPSEPVVAVAMSSGTFQLIDYADCTIQFVKEFGADSAIQSMAFSATLPTLLALSLAHNRLVISLPSNRLQIVAEFTIPGGPQKLHGLKFSPCGMFLTMIGSEPANTTTRHLVYLFSRRAGNWIYVGRNVAHASEIVQIGYALAPSRASRLFTLSSDRTVVEFDLDDSSETAGLRTRHVTVVDRGPATPTSMVITRREDGTLNMLLANTAGKLRTLVCREPDGEWVCVRSVLGPVNPGAELGSILLPLPKLNETSLLAYQSSSRYVGLLELPVQQHRSTAIIGHGERIAHLLAAHDGKYLLTCDSRYHCLNLWRVDAERFRQTVQASATMHAYSDADLAIVRDYLAYAMLEDSAVANNVGEEITARHVVTVMRALGYFPSNADIVDIERELCYTQEPRAVLLEAPPTPDMLTFTIDVHMFVTLLVNHRPVNDDVTLATIGSALDALTEGQERERVIAALGSVGEIMKTEELVTCLKAIRPDLEPDSLPDTANAETFMDAWLDLGDQMKI